mgnify:CR=1 FL=1
MLFQIIHSHTSETCPAKSPEAAKRSGEWWQALKKTSGIKVLVGTVSPLDHTFYITVEADDYPTLTRTLWPLLGIGTGDVIPVITLDQALPLAEDLASRTSK